MDDVWWQSWADDSADHRDPADPDVAEVLGHCRHDGELDHLLDEDRDLASRWDKPAPRPPAGGGLY